MFVNKTVVLLGAGASWHYGYPTGETLIEKVREKALSLEDYFRKHTGQNIYVPKYIERKISNLPPGPMRVRQGWDIARKECEDLALKLRQANPLVIDYFLGWNEDLQDIGRLIIALVILELEAGYISSRRNGNRNPNEHVKAEDDWCRFILHKLVSGCDVPSHVSLNDVTFVTFNYDVSLEYKIYEGLSALRTFSDDIDSFFSENRFLHIYGSVRTCPPIAFPNTEIFNDEILIWTTFSDRDDVDLLTRMKSKLDFADEASQRIRTIDPHDKGRDDNVLQLAKDAISRAECVYILGYGFDQNNSERLDLESSLRAGKSRRKHVMFTNFGDRNQINKKASKLFLNAFDRFLPNQPAIHGDPYNGKFSVEKSVRDVYGALALDFDDLEAVEF